MNIMRYEEIKSMLEKLEKRGKVGKGDMLMYFISPFLKGLGYDTFDLDVVDMRQDEGTAYVKVTDELSMVVSLTDLDFKGTETSKIYLRVDLETKEMTLYFNVMEKWEEIVRVNLAEDDDEKYVEVTKRIAKEQIDREYLDKGERFLSEIVIDFRLEQGEWDNDFLKRSLMAELESPSDKFVELMAERLGKDYTTRDTKWIKERLVAMPGKGVLHLVKKSLGAVDGQEEVVEEVETEEVETEEDGMPVDLGNDKKEEKDEEITGDAKQEEKIDEELKKEEPEEGSLVAVIEDDYENKHEEDIEKDNGVSREVNISIEEDGTNEKKDVVTDITGMFNFGDTDVTESESKERDIFAEELVVAEEDKEDDKKEEDVDTGKEEKGGGGISFGGYKLKGNKDFNKGTNKKDKKGLLDFTNL